MSVVASLGIILTAEGDQMAAVFTESTRTIKRFADETDKRLGNIGGGFKGMIESGKKATAEVASTAAIIKLVAQTVDMAAKSVSEFSNEVLKGEKSWDQMLQGGMDSLPIIGSATKATQSVVDAFWDASAATLKTAGYSEQVTDAWMSNAQFGEKIANQAKATAEAWEKMQRGADLVGQLDDELELLNAANDAERERIKLRHELRDQLKQIGKSDIGDDAKRTAQDRAKELNAKKLADFQKKLDDEALAERGKKLEAEANYWLGKWDKITDQISGAKKEDDKLQAKQAAGQAKLDASRGKDVAAEVEWWLKPFEGIAEAVKEAASLQTKETPPEIRGALIERGSADAWRNANRDTSIKVEKDQLEQLKKISSTIGKSLSTVASRVADVLPSLGW